MCMSCGSPLPEAKIMFRDLCLVCGAPLHSCRHCRFYKPGAYRDCAETVPEEVSDKEKANFCEYFSPGWAPAAVGGKKAGPGAKDAFDKLFG